MISRNIYWDHAGISQSILKELQRSPHHYRAKFIDRSVPEVSKETLRRGRALHAALFEPDTFAERFPVFDGERRSNADKARYAEMEAQASALDGCVIRESEAEDIRGMVASLRGDAYVAGVVRAISAAEHPIEWDCPTTGILCKARLDAYSKRLHSIVDLKTTTDASKRGFPRSIANYGYALQAAHYLAGVEAVTGERPAYYVIVAIENTPPYAVAYYELGPLSIEAGERERLRLLDLLAECRAKDSWPGYTSQIERIEMPAYALNLGGS